MLEQALLFLVFFGPLAFGCVEPWSLSTLQVAMFSLPFMAGRNGQSVPPSPRTILLGICVLLALGVAQALNPALPDGPMPLLPFTASAWQTKKALLLWSSYAALVWGSSRCFAGSRAAHRFAGAIVLIGFAIAFIGLIQSAHGNTFILGFRVVPYGSSPFGPYYNNAHAASLLAVCALMGCGLLGSRLSRIFRGSAHSEPRADAVARELLLAFLIGVILLGIYETRNRGSWLALGGAGMATSLLACGFLERQARRWGTRAAILILLLGAGGAALRFGFLKRGATVSVPVRLSMYQSGLRLLADAPLWGTGLGTVITVFEPYKEPVVEGIVDHVHNDWLELPLQAGVPVAAFMLAALGAFGWRVYRGWMREPSVERRFVIGGGVAAALCFLLHALVEFTLQIPANAVILFLILSWLWSQTEERTSANSVKPQKLLSAAAFGVLALLALRPSVGWALAQRGQFDAAFAWDADPSYMRRASTQHFKAGRLEPALAAAGAGLRVDPLNPSLRALHAQLLANLYNPVK